MNDHDEIFDQIGFESSAEAISVLKRNGFSLFADDRKAQGIITPPREPFSLGSHPDGKIYSTGMY